MRSLRGWGRFFEVLFAVASVAPRASAELLVVTSPGEPPALSHAEVALATGSGDTVTWVSLRIRRGPVAVVAALPESTTVEPALDAWLRALERTASPHVLLPRQATDCGKSASFVNVAWPRSSGVGGDELRLTEPEDVWAALEEHGLGEGVELPSAPRYRVWSWPVADGEETTRTLRFSGESGALSFVPAARWPVLLSSLSREPRQWPGEVGIDDVSVTFFAGQQRTDYVQQIQARLRNSPAPLLEARSSGTVFGWSILEDTVSLPPLVRSYARAAAEESEDVDAERCVQQLQARQDAQASSAAACGSAKDASLALGAAGDRPVLQRFVLAGDQAIGPDSLQEGGEPRGAALRAVRLDESACPPLVPTPPVVVPPGSGGGNAPPAQGGTSVVVPEEPAVDPYRDESCSCAPGRDPRYHDPHYSQSRSTWYCGGDTSSTAGDDSCSGSSSSSSSDDSCSSDSSSSSSDDSCSSDSSSSSSDDGCSSDSSSSSSDDSCSSDSSSSSGSSDGCSGGSDTSYDGDTCTGSAAPGAEPKASQASLTSARPRRPQRLRLSFWSLAMAAVLLPIRRRKAGRVR